MGSQKGNSLMQVSIAAAILSFISLTVATVISSGQKNSQNINKTLELNYIKEDLSIILSNPIDCATTFGGQPVAYNGTFSPGVNSRYQDLSAVQIGSATLNNFNSPNSVKIGKFRMKLKSGNVVTKNFLSELEVIPLNPDDTIIAQIKPRKILMNLTLDPADRILSCFTGAASGPVAQIEYLNYPPGANDCNQLFTKINQAVGLGVNSNVQFGNSSQHAIGIDGSWELITLQGDCSPMSNRPTRINVSVARDIDGNRVSGFYKVTPAP